jgi:hypothetical protein
MENSKRQGHKSNGTAWRESVRINILTHSVPEFDNIRLKKDDWKVVRSFKDNTSNHADRV